jgi:RNA polymerase sigma-70 factor (ECF subfamily)
MVTPDSINLLDSHELMNAFSQIDPLYQAAVALFYLEDYAYREIADILDVPIGTVKSRISRGIRQLHQRLSDSVRGRSKAGNHQT